MSVGGTLLDAARVTVRPDPDGPDTDLGRLFIGRLPKGAWCPPLKAAGWIFAVETARGDAAPTTAEPADAAAIETAIAALADASPAAGGTDGALPVPRRLDAQNEEVGLAAGEAVTSGPLLWAVTDEAALALAADQPPLRAVPVGGGLRAIAVDAAKVRRMTTDALLNAPCGADLAAAVGQLAAVLAARASAQERARRITRAHARAEDEETLSRSFVALSTTTGTLTPIERSRPLVAALEAALETELPAAARSFRLDPSASLHTQLTALAHPGHYRIRAVLLEQDWWRAAGPAMVVQRRADGQPLAALPKGSRTRLFDPATGRTETVDNAVAGELMTTAFMVYPSLPERVRRADLAGFVMQAARSTLARFLIAGVGAVLLALLFPIATAVIVGQAIPAGRGDLVFEMALIVGAASFAVGALSATRALAVVRAAAAIDTRLHAALWDRTLRLPVSFFRRFTTGDLTLRIISLAAARRILSGSVINGFFAGIFGSLSFVVMVIFDPLLAVLGFALAVLLAVSILAVARRELAFLERYRALQGAAAARLLEALVAIAKLRVAAAEERGFARWAALIARQEHFAWKGGRMRSLVIALAVPLPGLGLIGVFLIQAARETPIEAADFAAFNAALGQFAAATASLTLALGAALQAVPLARRAGPLMATATEEREARSAPGWLSGAVAFKGVSFRYSAADPMVLRDLDFAVSPGEFVAIAGHSGAGKSTILRLLLGFERPDAGAILYDGRDLASTDLYLLRRQLGVVMQDVGLVPGSIYDNIAMGAVLSDDAVTDAVRLAALEDDLKALPMGLDTVLADGQGLSSGQRQRVLIARALARKPRMIFLDEATSMLDNTTQAVVRDNLSRLRLTRIVIAHRLTTVREADRILVLDKGTLAEAGRFDELMDRRGVFFALARDQLAARDRLA